MISFLKSGNRRALLLGLGIVVMSLLVFSMANAGPLAQDDDIPPDAGMPGFTDYGDPVVPVFVDTVQIESEMEVPFEEEGPPTIDVWYGATQNFGQWGNPQPLVDVLGNARGEGSRRITAISYKLNGGAEKELAIGPDRRRLARKGDFHIELEKGDLNSGANQVVIMATDSANETTQTAVTINFTPGVTWPSTQGADWSSSTKLLDVAQPVDGKWNIDGDKLRIDPADIGYDRLVALGDVTWTNYEVTVPFIAYGIDPEGFKNPSNGPGLGIIARWPGYFQVANEQPREGWQKLGALAWHRWVLNNDQQVVSGLQMLGYSVGYGGVGNEIATNPNVQIEFGTEYYYKMSVQTKDATTDVYRFKVWRKNQSEPSAWHMVGEVKDAGRPASGSVVLLAHHVDVAFGNVVVKPTSGIKPVLTVNEEGNGGVTVAPPGPYDYGDVVTLTAMPDSGNLLARWSGDLDVPVGRKNEIQVALTQPQVDITAHFVAPNYGQLTLNVNANQGGVTASPQGPQYLIGEWVSVKASPTDGYRFNNWAGDLSSSENPYAFVFPGNTTLTANFAQKTAFQLDLQVPGGGGTILREPDKTTYYENDVVKLTALADAGYTFDSWDGDLAGLPNPGYLTMTSNKTVIANFRAVGTTYTLNVTANGPGTVLVEPDKDNYLYNELVTLTAVPNSADYMLGNWGGDLTGNVSPRTFAMRGNYNITANFVPAIAPRSDDFSGCVLNESLWTIADPIGDSSFDMTGTSLKISVPAGTVHDLWTNANNAPRILTPASNQDFGLEVKFDTAFQIVPANQYQTQGIIVQESNDKFLRFDFYNSGSETRAFAATYENGTATSRSSKTVPNGSPLYMRVARVGDQWTQSYSSNGTSWTKAAEFSYALNVSEAGLFAANPGKSPAFTAEFDYFFNSAAPIVPQGTAVNTLSVTTSGEGTVTVSPQKDSYACGEQVTLTAVPAADWNFVGWGGDLSGLANPTMLTIARSHAVVANFSTGEAGYQLYMPVSMGSSQN